jgi:N6-adenosine-specific RNA methylase IME4/ParB-like chromosome segregation protein Spo0J
MQYKTHPYADIFPLMSPDEFVALKQDIKQNGLLEPICLYEGKILDGRNRFKACQDVGVDPVTKDYEGDDPLNFVVSLNLKRRHLSQSQKATAAVELLPLFEAEAKKRQGERTDLKKDNIVAILPPSESTPEPKEQTKSRDQAAKAVGVGGKYVSDAKKIQQERPEVFKQIKDGEKTLPQAKREMKEEQREQKRQENREKIESRADSDILKIDAKFPTIVIDPPWDWGDEGDNDQLGRAKPDYQTLSIHKLMDLPVNDLAMDDSHIYLWITNRSLPKGFQLLEKWGFRYITCLTWVKPSFGMGNYFRGQTEHVLFGVKGSLELKRKDVGTRFDAPRGENGHSSKPVEFYDLVESCSHGPYLELFSRGDRKDWSSWGENGIK